MLPTIADRHTEKIDALKIGQLAARAAVSVDAIRFYERRGILPPAERRPSGYRVYRQADVHRIRMTKALQKLGFTLDEVVGALQAFDAGTASCDGDRWRLEAVLARVDAKIDELRRLRGSITRTLEGCRAGQCPVLQIVNDASAESTSARSRGPARPAGSRSAKQTKRG